MNQQEKASVVILISGGGSNLQAIIDAGLDINLCAVISNKADAGGIQKAQKAGIATHVLNHKEFSSRETFDAALAEIIDQYSPQLVVLSGFMRILTENFVRHYAGKMINIHPSLLPKYQGLNTHQRAIDAGDKEHGASVHFVTEELDGGPIIIQAHVPVNQDDDAETLAARVLVQEHAMFPSVVDWFCHQRLQLTSSGVEFDGTLLDKPKQW